MPGGSEPIDAPEFEQDSFGNAFRYIDAEAKKWENPLSILALIFVSFGIKKHTEVYFAVTAQFIYWLLGYEGLDAMYNALAGYQVGRGRYKWTYLPTLLTAYESIRSFKEKGALTYKKSAVLGIYAIGYLLGYSRIL